MFLDLLEPRPGVIPLACAAPDTPPAELTECYAAILPELAATTSDIGYYPTGHPRLRHAIAEYYRERGVPTSFDQVLVTTGGQQALSLLARAFLQPGDRVLMEAPSSPPGLEVFRAEAAAIHTLSPGMPEFAAAARDHRPALAYAIPTFHNPTGAVLPPLARRRLAEAAAAAGVTLIEDEVLAELGFPGFRTPPPLAAHSDAVITVGSLSKTVWGGLRIGWMRAAAPTIARLARIRAVHDLGGDVPAQLAAAELMPRLAAVCARLAPERQARHDHLRAELARLLPEWHAPAVPGGQTLWVRLPYGDGTSFAQAALRHGVAILPGSGLDPTGGSEDHVRIHYLHPTDTLTEAARRLAEAWRSYRPPARAVPSPPALAV
ncbi:DNA-binding transcriptional MocR family regulator [Nocardia tenerifensis]|uniref:DNA-binding transcriptional MocR family regulator n=1 Tax=Nocardia tenerifensis TaxID=228006 RepID=A0A318KRN7_9NOCA|nr:PLP-dependent aminotransferase family protein [Nocardia tenerifensis]PXX65607.1 DNA-binding transcriptional MocR family regulator [Nocardia tenerifensis]